MVAAAAASIVNRGSDLVGLTELCAGQYSALITRLRDAGWPQDPTNFARFQVMLPAGGATGGVCGGQDFGMALFSRVPLGGAPRVQLLEDGRVEEQYLLCAPLSGSTARACVTHITTALTLTSGTPVNTAQLNAALTAVEARHDAGDTVLTLGDFNAQPNYGRIAVPVRLG